MVKVSLFDPFQLGPLRLRNRTIMAPLTRSRATPEGVPTEIMEIYYAQRASAGLIISEGVVVSPQGVAYPRVPGLYSEEQAQSWRRITGAVHERGGLIFAQLWHVGRQSHSSVQPDGLPPFAPSAKPILNHQYYRKPDRLPYETPRELSRAGIRAIITDFAAAAERAVSAGFDGIEIHGANGYLIDQFLNSGSNLREDEYGGSIANRVRFLHELLESVGGRISLSRVGVRLSPSSNWMDAIDKDKTALHSHVVDSLNSYGLAYLHLVEPSIAGAVTSKVAADAVPTELLSARFNGPVIVTGEHDRHSAEVALNQRDADLIGFGRKFIANPDLPERLHCAAPLNSPDKKSFYSGGAEGYITYPSLKEEARWAELRDSLDSGQTDLGAITAELAERSPVRLARDGDLYPFSQLQHLISQTVHSTT